jgi:cytochrome c oxidase assembly factor CtaG
MEVIERRALWLILTVALVVAFNRPADFTSVRGKGWELTIYLVSLLCLAAAAALLVVAIAPTGVIQLLPDRRERLLFLAFALIVAAILATLLLRGYGVWYLHRHGTGGLG